jgi:hypothetical protein
MSARAMLNVVWSYVPADARDELAEAADPQIAARRRRELIMTAGGEVG